MSIKHTFKATVNWNINEGESTLNPRTFSRNHEVLIDNKATPLQPVIFHYIRCLMVFVCWTIRFDNLVEQVVEWNPICL